MTVKDLQELYDYGYWANSKLFQVISRLSGEDFTRPLTGGQQSIRTTMVHILNAEWGWLARCGGPQRGPRLNPSNYPTIESLIEEWDRVEGYMRIFLSQIHEEDLSRNAEYTNDFGEKRSLPLGELIQHGANHGVHHRGQVALLLRHLGHVPGNFDLLFYYGDKRGVPAW